jgi:acyl-CoA synthetase (AMP-forming)/AMP-acid ligase II
VFQDWFEAGELLRLIEEEKVSFLLGSPVQFHMMANHPDLARRDLSSLDYMVWGGAPMAEDLVRKLAALPGRLCTAFGMTELGLYATYSDLDAPLEVLGRTIGRPHAGYDIRVADADGNEAEACGDGEIQARGPWLMAGYFRDETATREAYTADGWFRTGDTVKVWPDGNLEIVGRLKEMFISGGFNIYPREIEIVLESHPAAGLVAVLGVPDETFGEVGHAFVEPLPGQTVTDDELRAWCRERLANYKVPKTFSIRTELPRLPIGKIDKQDLRRELAR